MPESPARGSRRSAARRRARPSRGTPGSTSAGWSGRRSYGQTLSYGWVRRMQPETISLHTGDVRSLNITLPRFAPPLLTRPRVWSAYAVAVAADVLQLVLGPFGWTFADEGIDIVAAAVTWGLLGFHPLLLPTFVVEFLPIVDMLPTWTGCVALVVALRKREQAAPPPPSNGPIIDV